MELSILRNLGFLEDLWICLDDFDGDLLWIHPIKSISPFQVSPDSSYVLETPQKSQLDFFWKIGRVKVFANSQQSCLLWFQDILGPPLRLPLHYPGQGPSTCAEKKSDPSMVVVWDIDRKGQRVVVNVCFWIGCSFFFGISTQSTSNIMDLRFSDGMVNIENLSDFLSQETVGNWSQMSLDCGVRRPNHEKNKRVWKISKQHQVQYPKIHTFQ